MRILIIGKRGSIVHWMENCLYACQQLGLPVKTWSVTGQNWLEHLSYKIQRLRSDQAWEKELIASLQRCIHSYRPDLILFIGAYHIAPALLEAARSLAHNAGLAGWVGDRFDAACVAHANLLDHVFYTDRAFVRLAQEFEFSGKHTWLPLAADTQRFQPGKVQREGVVFVANPTAWRKQVIGKLSHPVRLYGRHWDSLKATPHHIHNRRLPAHRLPPLYAGALGVINIRNEQNVLQGLNQRSFEPLACATPVLNDDLPDLPLCFDPGREIIVWQDVDELDDWIARLEREPDLGRRIGEAGRRRVVAEHTYVHRIRSILHACGLA